MKVNSTEKVSTTARIGISIGRVTCQKRCHALAPSIIAASYSEGEMSRGKITSGCCSSSAGRGRGAAASGWLSGSANTIGGGTYGNIITGVTLDATSGSTLANVGTASTLVLGPLAVLCSTIGLVLGVVGAAKSHRRAEELEKLKTVIADPHARAAADYALAQKEQTA